MLQKPILISTCFLLSFQCVFADALPCSELCSAAGVVQFVFTSEPQIVLLNTLSDPITIQAQNESGVQESTTETTDLTFTSSSPTGQFLSSTGKQSSKTMAKGTANRTFYYSDTALGTFTLSVTAVTRTSKKSFSTTQQITIASVLPTNSQPIIKPIIKPTIKASTKTNTTVSKKSTTSQKNSSTESLDVSQSNVESTTTSNLATIYEGISKTSAFDSLFDWPSIFWHWLLHLF